MTEGSDGGEADIRRLDFDAFSGDVDGFLGQARQGRSFLITLRGEAMAEIRPLPRSPADRAHCGGGSAWPTTSTFSRRT